MKKFIMLLLTLSLIFCSVSFTNYADTYHDDVFYYDGDIEVIVENDDLTRDEKQIIADYIVYGDSGISTYGFACLFGHDLSTTYATEITHNVYSASPKCVKKKYKVERCTRSSCDYINKTLVETTRINTCHG